MADVLTTLFFLLFVPAADPVPPGLPPLVRLLAATDDDAVRADVLRGISAALAGRRDVPMPAEWPATYRLLAKSRRADVRERASLLAVQFGDAEALAQLKTRVADTASSTPERTAALEALLTRKGDDLPPL